MPKRNTLPKVTMPDYVGTGKEDINHEVQKAKQLISLANTPLTLPELKILDAYLARIDSHDDTKRTVRFEKGELERALRVDRIRREELDKRLDNLFCAITIVDPDEPKGFCKIGLFAKAEAVEDDTGLWQVDLACTEEAKKYIFNLDNSGYFHYRLKNVVNLTSRYSYLLFLLLCDKRGLKNVVFELDELKQLLNCTADSYKGYKEFNDKVLKKSQKEICEKTDMNFTYSPIKRGRYVAKVEFRIKTQNELVEQVVERKLEDTDPLTGEFVGQTTIFTSIYDRLTDDEKACLKLFFSSKYRLTGDKLELVFNRSIEEICIKAKLANKKISSPAAYLTKALINADKRISELIDKYDKIEESKPSFDLDEWQKMADSFDPSTLSFDEEADY